MHIFVSGFAVTKSRDGEWFVSQLRTSEGTFNLGPEVSKENQISADLEEIGKKVKERLVHQIVDFMKNEKK